MGDDLISSRFSRTAAISGAAMRSTAFGFLSSFIVGFSPVVTIDTRTGCAFESLRPPVAIRNDDTSMKILALVRVHCERASPRRTGEEEASEEEERAGLFTSGIVSTYEGWRIALFFT